MGRSTRWLARERGQEYEREVVHRDNLVILAPSPAWTAPGAGDPGPSETGPLDA